MKKKYYVIPKGTKIERGYSVLFDVNENLDVDSLIKDYMTRHGNEERHITSVKSVAYTDKDILKNEGECMTFRVPGTDWNFITVKKKDIVELFR